MVEEETKKLERRGGGEEVRGEGWRWVGGWG